ncbi:hypothetical protein PORY_001780 [Pneumocystis oryctolagi]|uniref:Uncharacterized protein n=1 Tax=Pneumocystis oryctolagi TaxID=42067 RepID=A0ACB7CAH2_9ASCO|nr:hypothetical protein PORY_001780 [Pneumocystis oryctolagi]
MKSLIGNIFLWTSVIFTSYIFLTYIVSKIIKKITGVYIHRFGYFSIHGIRFCYKEHFDIYFESLKIHFHRPTINKKTWISFSIVKVFIKINKFQKKKSENINEKGFFFLRKYRQKCICWIFKALNSYIFFRVRNWVNIIVTDTKISIGNYDRFVINTFAIRFDNVYEHNLHFEVYNDSLNALRKKTFKIINTLDSIFFISKNGTSELIDRVFISFQGVFDYPIKNIKCVLECGKVQIPFGKLEFLYNDELKCFFINLFNSMLNNNIKEEENVLKESLVGPDRLFLNEKKYWFDIIDEIQFHVSNLEVKKKISSLDFEDTTFFSLKLKDIGINIKYIDCDSGFYKHFFKKKSISYEILASCISLVMNIYQEMIPKKETDFILIPMITFTSKVIFDHLTYNSIKAQTPNTINIVVSSVITSPSIDLSCEKLQLITLIFKSTHADHTLNFSESQFLQNSIFKLSINCSIHDPVARILISSKKFCEKFQYKKDIMLVLSLSNIFLDIHASVSNNKISDLSFVNMAILFISQKLYYQCSFIRKYNIFVIEKFIFRLKFDLFPLNNISIGTFHKNISINLNNIEIIQCLDTLFSDILLNIRYDGLSKKNTKIINTSLYKFNQLLKKVECQGLELSIIISGNEPEINPEHKGVSLKIDSWQMDYCFSNINSKELFLYVYKEKNPLNYKQKHNLNTSILNIISNSKGTLSFNGFKIFTVCSENILDIKEPIMKIIKFELSFNIEPDNKSCLLFITAKADQIYMTYSLLKHYAILLAIKILEKIFFQSISKILQSYGKNSTKTNNSLWEFILIQIYTSSTKIKFELPSEQFLMVDIYNIKFSHDKNKVLLFEAENITSCAHSPVIQNFWDRIINIDHLTVYQYIKTDYECVPKITLFANAIRIRIPHKFILHIIIDSIQNNIKSAKQLHCHFFSNVCSVLKNQPVKAKVIHKIQLKSDILSLDIEDDPFEARLGFIWRIGLIEQKARIMRETTFDIKAKKVQNELDLINNNEESKIESENDFFSENSFDKQELKQSYDKQGYYIKNSKNILEFSENRFSNLSSITTDQAYEKLQKYNSQSWIRKFRKMNDLQSSKLYSMRHKHWINNSKYLTNTLDNILPLPTRPPLLSVLLLKVDFILDKPSFPMINLPQFLQDTGKGLPLGTEFFILIPFNLIWKMSETKVYIRDYPLPLVYIPCSSSQSVNIPTWTFTSDLVIAEQFPEKEAIHYLDICIIPSNIRKQGSCPFNIKISRTITPIKIYGVIDIVINTVHPTQITWGMSLQPAIQDIMRVFETFSKYQENHYKLSFWDKIRLIMHTSLKLKWEGNGNVYLILKGSRDPYCVTGDGAGFVKCWKGNVQWNIGCDSDSKNLMVINSDEFLLAIPDFTQYARDLINWPNTMTFMCESVVNTYQNNIYFQKVVMKLKGGVKWIAGLVFEQHCSDICQKCNGKYQCRTFDFKPHYEVMLRVPKYVSSETEKYDAFNGFRSHYLHGSLSIICPMDLSLLNFEPVYNFKSYNAIHLTPKVFQHFFNWWSLFNGIMSFPLKTGKLFPFPYTSKKKIGRYLTTFKYKLELSPLFLSHIYNYRTDLDWVDKTFTSIGIKSRITHFVLDVHQKKEERNVHLKQLNRIKKNTNIIIDNAAIDFTSTDLRVILSRFNQMDREDSNAFEFDSQKNYDFKIHFRKNNINHFTYEDDFKWVDIDDFIDLDLDIPIKGGPVFKILPLAYIPQFSYFRETSYNDPSSRNNYFSSEHQFKNEDMRSFLNKKKDPYNIQIELIQKRQNEIIEQIDKNKIKLNCIENIIMKSSKGNVLKSQYEKIVNENVMLYNKYDFINTILSHIKADRDKKTKTNKANVPIDHFFTSNCSHEKFKIVREESISEQFVDFNNRFFVHNIQLKWYNSVRNILLAYIHQITQRKGFMYYMSQRAVKFIINLIKEQMKVDYSLSVVTDERIVNNQEFDDQETRELIHDLINNVNNNFTITDERTSRRSSSLDNNSVFRDDIDYIFSKNYECQRNYVFKLFAPQIQLQSEKNNQVAVIMTAQNMQLKVFSIMDKSMTDDMISGLVQQKYIVKMNNAQVFISRKESFIENSVNFFHTNNYGSFELNWSPWIPLESIYDFSSTPIAFTRVVDQTSASFRFIKHNRLRLKKNDNLNYNGKYIFESFKMESPEQCINSIFVDFPKIVFTANSDQYYVIFLIVTDLLIYTEPAQKERSERLERLMLAADFSDLTGTAEMVIGLQEKIRKLEEMKAQYKLYYENYNMEHRLIKVKIEAEMRDCEDELFYLMKSIATSQKHEEKIDKNMVYMSWFFSASEIIWHSLLGNNKPFIDFGLSNATYQRTDNFDGSNFNIIEIETIQGINLLPETIFPDLLSPYFTGPKSVFYGRKKKMIRIYWHMLDSIGGIPVMDHFEVNLFPLSIKLEHDVGKKIFEYIFPDKGSMNSSLIQEKTNPLKMDTSIDRSNDENYLKTNSWHPFYSNRNSSVSLLMSSIKYPIESFLCSSKLSRESIKSNSSFQIFSDSENFYKTDTLKLSKNDTQVTDSGTFEKIDRVNKFQLKAGDDLNQMVLRANNNMTLLYVKVPSVILCLSYKGPRKKNIEDLNNFVFCIPTIEYRNKTWSYFDLALHLKKEVIKTIIGHTGSLVKDKFMQHCSNQKTSQIKRQYISFKINMPLNHKNKKIEHLGTLLNTIEDNNLTKDQLHLNNKHGSYHFLEQSSSSSPYLSKYKDNIEELEENKVKKARMLLGCDFSRLWEIVEDFYTIYFDSSCCIDDDFKCYFWKFFVFLPDLILNEIDDKSTPSNLILRPIKTKEIDLKLLEESYNDRIRMTVIPEKQFLALTGKELDEENKHIMRYFDLLSIIFKHKEKGINQVDLVKQLNIDPRSLPSRINPLIEKGLMFVLSTNIISLTSFSVKSPIIISKTQTFLLIHSHYAVDSSKKSQNDFQNSQNTDDIVDINHLRTCITNVLSKAENNIMRFVDLKRLCKINNKLFRRGFSKQIRSMEQLGFVERCRVANNKGYSKCVKLIKSYNVDFAKQENEIDIHSNKNGSNFSDNNNNNDKKKESALLESTKSTPIVISRDLTLEFLLFQEIKNSGKNGIPGPDLKKQVIGDQWSRPLQLILDKLSIVPEKILNQDSVQPSHLSYFTIYKEQEFIGRVSQYRYLSSLNYQAFCFENKIVNTIKLSYSDIIFPKYDEFEFYLYDQNPNIPNKNINIKSIKLEEYGKYYDEKDSGKEKDMLFENFFPKDNIPQNIKKSLTKKQTEKGSIDFDPMDLESNFKRTHSQEINEEVFSRKKQKMSVKPPVKTILTKPCSGLNTCSLSDSSTLCSTLEMNNQISDLLIPEVLEKSTREYTDKNNFENQLVYDVCEENVSVKKNIDLLSGFSDNSVFKKNSNIGDKNANKIVSGHEPRISLAYVRRQNLILEILHKNGGILQGGKYLNEQYNIAFKNKAYSTSEHEIDRKTMEKTLESLKRVGKIHHICVAHTNTKGVKSIFWIVADAKYDINGAEINDFKNKILEERSMKIQTYKPMPLKIENLHLNYPIKLKKKQISYIDHESSEHIQSNHVEHKHISEKLELKEHEPASQNSCIANNQILPIVSETKTPFIYTFMNNKKTILEKETLDIETKLKFKHNEKSLLRKKLQNCNTADAFPFVGKQRLSNKNNLCDKIDETSDHERVYKSISMRKKSNFTSDDDDTLIRAIFLSKFAYGGNSGFIDWELIEKVLPHHSQAEIKSRFSTLRSKSYIKEIGNFFATSWISYYQNAVKNKILPSISPIPDKLDILKLIEYSRTLNILENYDDIDLPDSIEEILTNYIVESVSKREDIRSNFFDASLSLNAREIILYGTSFSYSNNEEKSQDENEVKSLIKSILITPEEKYDPEVAKKLLEPYEENYIESVLQELIQDKIIVKSKVELNRILPGRNYRFSDKFLLTFKSCYPDFLFLQASECYMQITQEFQKNNTYTLSEFINSGSVACILDLVAHHYIQLSIENVMDVFCKHIYQYSTENWEDYTINFTVTVQPKNTSYISLDKSIKYPESLKRYIWIDIWGNMLKNVYNQYLQTILSLIMQRPGINLTEIINILYPAVSIEEIRAIISCLVPNIVRSRQGALYTKELYYKSTLKLAMQNNIQIKIPMSNSDDSGPVIIGMPEDGSEKRGTEFKCVIT